MKTTLQEKIKRRLIALSVVLLLFTLSACAGIKIGGYTDEKAPELFARQFLEDHPDFIGKAAQVVFVVNEQSRSSTATMIALEKEMSAWMPLFPGLTVNIGRNGFAEVGEKREGDGKSPSGVFRLGTAFGYAPEIETIMPYRRATENDFWVDDIDSPYYNKWVSGDVGAASVEKMKRDDGLYRYGIVIEYNTNPIVKGLGSAIFMHVWPGEAEPTSGCISMPEEIILRLLAWLDPAKEPLVVMGTEAELRSLNRLRQLN